MARRPTASADPSTDPATDTVSTDTDASSVVTDAPVTDASATVTDQPADASTDTPSTDASDTPATPAPAEVPFDFGPFQSTAETAVATADQTTGLISDENLVGVTEAYKAIAGVKNKNKAKQIIIDGVKDGMNKASLPIARAYMQINTLLDNVKGTTGGSEPKAPADPTEAFVNQVTAYLLAVNLLKANLPEGVNYEVAGPKIDALLNSESTSAQELLAYSRSTAEDKGDEPKASIVTQAAVKLVLGKGSGKVKAARAASTYTGDRRSIATHIANAFADKESGTFLTVADIKAIKSPEYGDDSPSSGAISARLFPPSGKCTVEGISPGQKDGKKGATKV